MAPLATACEFRCKDGSCIRNEDVCNNEEDCSDGSDESDCEDSM